jgi:hypothetical protein
MAIVRGKNNSNLRFLLIAVDIEKEVTTSGH